MCLIADQNLQGSTPWHLLLSIIYKYKKKVYIFDFMVTIQLSSIYKLITN